MNFHHFLPSHLVCDMVIITRRLLFTIIISTVFAAQVYAAGGQVYSWTDEEGNTHYGNKPPSGHKTEAVAATLSRYDSQKLIDRLKRATVSAKLAIQNRGDEDAEEGNGENADAEDEQPKVAAKKPAKQEGRVIVHGVNAALGEDDNLTISRSLENLEAGDIQIKYDDNFNIISCNVTVKNTGGKEQHGVAIVFNFKDNSKIVADGPVTLSAGKEGVYEIPADLLPFSLKQKYRTQDMAADKLTKKQIKEKLTPNVIVGL